MQDRILWLTRLYRAMQKQDHEAPEDRDRDPIIDGFQATLPYSANNRTECMLRAIPKEIMTPGKMAQRDQGVARSEYTVTVDYGRTDGQ